MAARNLSITVVRGLLAIQAHLPALHRLASACGQPGTMHGLDLLLGSQFARRKHPFLLCFHRRSAPADGDSVLAGAVLLQEYSFLRIPMGIFATADPFGVRTVVGPRHLHGALCLQASRFLVGAGARLVLATWRPPLDEIPGDVMRASATQWTPDNYLYSLSTRTVQDTLPMRSSAAETLQTLGKRTRVHMRAARRQFDAAYPDAVLQDATVYLAAASDDTLRQLNEASLDVIGQEEFNHQVRTLCRSADGFVIGLHLAGCWIALIGGWRQDDATWIEWQCNGRGFEKLSLGSVLRTYLLEEEAKRGARYLSFHGGTSHSMLHRFLQTPVADLLTRRPGLLTSTIIRVVPWICRRWPKLLLRGNFLLNALCADGLHWSTSHPVHTSNALLPEG